MNKRNPQFDLPIQKGETRLITIGCRHSNPDICNKNGLHNVCAFVSEDGRCHSPPATWGKRFSGELKKDV